MVMLSGKGHSVALFNVSYSHRPGEQNPVALGQAGYCLACRCILPPPLFTSWCNGIQWPWFAVPSQGRYQSCWEGSRPVWQSDTTLCAILADGLTSTSDGSTVSVMRAEMTHFFSTSLLAIYVFLQYIFFLIWCLFVLWEWKPYSSLCKESQVVSVLALLRLEHIGCLTCFRWN